MAKPTTLDAIRQVKSATPQCDGLFQGIEFPGDLHCDSLQCPTMSHFVHIGYITVNWPKNKKTLVSIRITRDLCGGPIYVLWTSPGRQGSRQACRDKLH